MGEAKRRKSRIVSQDEFRKVAKEAERNSRLMFAGRAILVKHTCGHCEYWMADASKDYDTIIMGVLTWVLNASRYECPHCIAKQPMNVIIQDDNIGVSACQIIAADIEVIDLTAKTPVDRDPYEYQ